MCGTIDFSTSYFCSYLLPSARTFHSEVPSTHSKLSPSPKTLLLFQQLVEPHHFSVIEKYLPTKFLFIKNTTNLLWVSSSAAAETRVRNKIIISKRLADIIVQYFAAKRNSWLMNNALVNQIQNSCIQLKQFVLQWCRFYSSAYLHTSCYIYNLNDKKKYIWKLFFLI